MQENLKTLSIQILIVTHGRERLLRRLLLELAQVGQPRRAEAPLEYRIQVVVNGRDPLTEALLGTQDCVPEWMVLEKAMSPSAARAEGLKRFSGCEWIWFLDDDVSVPQQTFQRVEHVLQSSSGDIDVLGGPNLTPLNSSWRQLLIGALLENPFVVGPVSQRYRQRQARPDFTSDDRALMLCHLVVRSSCFKSDLFLPGLLCGEENYFLCLLKERGARMRFSSGIPVFHERREAFGSFLVQIQKYGLGRGQLFRTLGPLRMGWFSWALAGGLIFLLSVIFIGSGGLLYLFGTYALLVVLAMVSLMTSSLPSLRGIGISLLMIPAIQLQYLRGFFLGIFRGSGPS